MTGQDRNLPLIQPLSARDGRRRASARGQETRERILVAAVRLMADVGYAAASISIVSAKANVQPASLYWAFESKEKLYQEALNWAFNDWIAKLPINWSPSNLDELRADMEALAGAFTSAPDFLRLMMLAVTEHRHGNHEILEASRKIREAGRAGFRSLVVSALPKDIDPHSAGEIAEKIAGLAQHLVDGIFLSMHLEPDILDTASRFRIFAGIIIREVQYLIARNRKSY